MISDGQTCHKKCEVYYVEVCSLNFQFAECFYHKWVLYLIKGNIQETYRQHHTQWAKIKAFPLRTGTSVSALTTFIQHSTESPNNSDQTRKRNERHPNWKEGSKNVTVSR